MKKKKALRADEPEVDEEFDEEEEELVNEMLPLWYDGKHFFDSLFCRTYLAAHPMLYVGGSFFTTEGRIPDEAVIGKEIYDLLTPYINTGAAKKVKNLLDTLKLEAFSPDLPVQTDRLHVANGTLFLDGHFSTFKEFCRNRLPVAYCPDAPAPRWSIWRWSWDGSGRKACLRWNPTCRGWRIRRRRG